MLPAGGLPPPITVDVIDDMLFVGLALVKLSDGSASRLYVKRLEVGWIPYIAKFDEAADVVIVRDELDDHVPTVLKVRALSEIGVRPVVLADQVSSVREQPLIAEGAVAVFSRGVSVQELAAYLGGLRTEEPRRSPRRGGGNRLSDRELQVACLFVGRAAPPTPVIAGLLGIPLASVRTYLQRARKVLSEVGPVSTRESLRDALLSEGWLNSLSR